MATCCIDDDRVWVVWNWCSDAYLRNGQRLKFPAKTNPVNTYQWRYVKAIAERFAEWQFDDDTCRKFIDLATKYAKDKGHLRKGLSILHQSNMLDICYEMLQREKESNRQSTNSIELVHKWLTKQLGDSDPLKVLLQRPHEEALCNLTQWYKAHRISDLYLAVSKSCCRALVRLGNDFPDERKLFPKYTKLYTLRRDVSRDIAILRDSRRILGKDWRELCQ
jgi:hypothetical protein